MAAGWVGAALLLAVPGAGRVAALAPALEFEPVAFYRVGGEAVVVADFTGDGRDDVASVKGWYGQLVTLFVQTQAGTFAEPQQVPAHIGSAGWVSAAAADIDNDGDTDLLAGSANGIDIFEQDAGHLLP